MTRLFEGRVPGKATHDALGRESYSEALLECRADITQYTIWYKSHTLPLLRGTFPLAEQLLDIDLKALTALVDRLIPCYGKAGYEQEIPAVLERLRSSIENTQWQRKMTYFQSMYADLFGNDRLRARAELKKLEPMAEETDVATIQLYLDVFGQDLTFSDMQTLINRILVLTNSDVDRLHYRSINALQFLEIGDDAKAEQELADAVASFRKSNASRHLSAYAIDMLASALDLLGVLRNDLASLDEAISLYRQALVRDDWTPKGRSKILRGLGDTYKHKCAWTEALDAYTRAEESEDTSILHVFRAECLLHLEGPDYALREIALSNPALLDESEQTDYVFVFAVISVELADRGKLEEAEHLLRGLMLSSPYFRSRRDTLLLSVIDTQRSGRSNSFIQNAKRALTGMVRGINKYVMLEPNFMGLGIRINPIVENLTKPAGKNSFGAAERMTNQSR